MRLITRKGVNGFLKFKICFIFEFKFCKYFNRAGSQKSGFG